MFFVQVGALCLGNALQYAFWGRIGFIMPTFFLFVASVAVFFFGSEEGWPLRKDVLWLSPRLSLMMWLLSTGVYVGFFFGYPQQFSFPVSKLFFLAPSVALGPALLTLITTLCAGDTALLLLGREDTSA